MSTILPLNICGNYTHGIKSGANWRSSSNMMAKSASGKVANTVAMLHWIMLLTRVEDPYKTTFSRYTPVVFCLLNRQIYLCTNWYGIISMHYCTKIIRSIMTFFVESIWTVKFNYVMNYIFTRWVNIEFIT